MKSKKQPTISRSSAKAEYHALAALSSELQWLKYILLDLGITHPEPMSVYCDNKAAIRIAKNLFFMNAQNTLN